MDKDLKNTYEEALKHLRTIPNGQIDDALSDPIAQMMLVALLNETQKVRDYAEGVTQRVTERYCADFIPRERVDAIPAITLVQPKNKDPRTGELFTVGEGGMFTLRIPAEKLQINYIPLFHSVGIPVYVSTETKSERVFLVSHRKMRHAGNVAEIGIQTDSPSSVYLCIGTKAEIECLKGLPLLIRGTNGMAPIRVTLVNGNRELEFATMREMEDIDMVEPFDAQQASGKLFSYMEVWKDCLLHIPDATLIYITDPISDRDVFKPQPYPAVLAQWLESEMLDSLVDSNCGNLWLRIDFPEGYEVSEDCEVVPNVVPVVNVDVCSLMLTQATPIAKLNKQENSFFLQVLETSTQARGMGFSRMSDDIIVRDFDASCYNNGELYRDVRNLYNRFIDDFHAFVEYNGIKDGEALRRLRECVNTIGKSVTGKNDKFMFDSGTFVMKNMSSDQLSSTVKVSYLTTLGNKGNTPKMGHTLECKKLPGLLPKAEVMVDAMGGVDKASADGRYEQLRYYSLTADRLYTRMDIEAFIRKEVMAEFGSEEFRRIYIRMRIEGSAGPRLLRRGLYIDIEFKDIKNYEHARKVAFDVMIHQRIQNKACIAMPIFIQLVNLEK